MDTVDQFLFALQNAQTNRTSAAFTALNQQLVDTIYSDLEAAAELLNRLLDAGGPSNAYRHLVDYVVEEDLPALFERGLPAAGLHYEAAEQRNVRLDMETAERQQASPILAEIDNEVAYI